MGKPRKVTRGWLEQDSIARVWHRPRLGSPPLPACYAGFSSPVQWATAVTIDPRVCMALRANLVAFRLPSGALEDSCRVELHRACDFRIVVVG